MNTRPSSVSLDPLQILSTGRKVVAFEEQALKGLQEKLGESFVETVRRLLRCDGRVIVTGMGKSGLVAQKISATLASTGTPSHYVHAADAAHGDLGRIANNDLVLALSHSGESEEIVRLVRPIRDMGGFLIALTGAEHSSLAQLADITLSIGEVREAEPMGLVPTASTTAMLALGDALAVCVFECRGFDASDFVRFHPGGALGQSLVRVHQLMRSGPSNPKAHRDAPLGEVLLVMTETPGRPGAASIIDDEGQLEGLFTDGDLRRLLSQSTFSIDTPVHKVMQKHPKTAQPDQLAVEAAQLMRQHQIDQVPVVDHDKRPIGLLDVQDLLSTRVF